MNFDPDTEAGSRNRQIAFSLLGLIAGGVVLVLLVGGLGMVAVRTVDIGTGEETPAGRSEPVPESTEPAPTQEPRDSRPSRDPDRAVLRASPQQVGSYEEIDLTGRMPEVGAGVTLQVQRRMGGPWTDFPVNPVTGVGGTFSTVVQTGQLGRNRFRLLDPATASSTPSVRVDVS